MVSDRFLPERGKWRGVVRFARKYLGSLATRPNACRGCACARAWLCQGTDEACGTLRTGAWLHRCIPGHLQFSSATLLRKTWISGLWNARESSRRIPALLYDEAIVGLNTCIQPANYLAGGWAAPSTRTTGVHLVAGRQRESHLLGILF